PGQYIVSARSRSAARAENLFVSPLYRAAAGTSMAAPHAAGVAALVLEVRPDMKKDALKRLLLETAAAPGADPRFGAGRVSASAAVERVAGRTGCACAASTGAAPETSSSTALLL